MDRQPVYRTVLLRMLFRLVYCSARTDAVMAGNTIDVPGTQTVRAYLERRWSVFLSSFHTTTYGEELGTQPTPATESCDIFRVIWRRPSAAVPLFSQDILRGLPCPLWSYLAKSKLSFKQPTWLLALLWEGGPETKGRPRRKAAEQARSAMISCRAICRRKPLTRVR